MDMNAVWEKTQDLQAETIYVRPLIGSEMILDQVHRLQNGHDHFAFGTTFSTDLVRPELESRLLNALVRLRYTNPIFAAVPTKKIHDPDLRSWVYKPIRDIQEAHKWAESVLRIKTVVAQSTPESELCDLVEQPLGDQEIFRVNLVGPYTNGELTLFVYASHAVLEGQAMMALIRHLFAWIMKKELEIEEELKSEASQIQRLDPGGVVAFGGLPERWNELSVPFLEKLSAWFKIKGPSHALKPQRTNVTTLGKIVRVHRSLDEQTTSRLLKATKTLGLTVTQVLEAAHVVATYAVEPLSSSEIAKSHIIQWPALVGTRHLRVPPYDRPDIFSNLNSGFALVFPTELIDFPPGTDIRTRVLAIARSSQAQYRDYLSFPYHMFTFPAQAAANPLRGPLGDDPNKHMGEITGLGLVDGKVGLEWYENESKEMPTICVKDVHLGLRQCNKRTMTHSWTYRGRLTLQVQAADIWNPEYLGWFLEELVKAALSICESV